LLEEVRSGTVVAANCDLDDGNATRAAEYTLADVAYEKLLASLTARKFDGVTPQLRDNILAFYSDLSLPVDTKSDPAHWQAVLADLTQLKDASLMPISDNTVPLAH